jgi:nucleoside-diphosphate-sugar epimerase
VSGPAPLRGRTVLVIGASGFLGGRLAERLVVEQGARVRALVRRVAGATRLARLPVEVVLGDVLDPAALAAAADGCAVVFNCAKGAGPVPARRRAVDVDAVRHLVEAAGRSGGRVVQVSSLAVYDLPRDGEVTERTPDAPPGDAYADAKLAGERLALELGTSRGVAVTVVQPTVVYGPHATVHAADILDELRTSRMILVDAGRGICNAVYVDDAVTALLLAATADRAPGERFLVSGPEHPTWAEFFGAFERMLGVQRLVPMTAAEARTHWDRSRRRGWLVPEAVKLLRQDKTLRKRLLATREGLWIRTLAEWLAPGRVRAAERWADPAPAPAEPTAAEPPLGPIRPWLVDYLAKRAVVRIDKARDLLGYRPVFGLEAGMRLTESWARWAGLLGR